MAEREGGTEERTKGRAGEETEGQEVTVDSDSPPSEEMKEQRKSGLQGAPRGQGGPAEKQPPQGSGRVHDAGPPRDRPGFEEGQRPSAQGDGDPGPRKLASREEQQGVEPKSGSTTGTARGDDEATVHEK